MYGCYPLPPHPTLPRQALTLLSGVRFSCLSLLHSYGVCHVCPRDWTVARDTKQVHTWHTRYSYTMYVASSVFFL